MSVAFPTLTQVLCEFTKLMVKLMPRLGASRIVYVSCNPTTLARDAGELMALGYRLKAAGVMDMFPHTNHVESMAVFEKAKKK